MTTKFRRGLHLDPRTWLVLLILSNIVVFGVHSRVLANVWVISLLILILGCGLSKLSIEFGCMFAFLLFLQNYILPVAPKLVIMTFAIFINYTLKMLPCLIVGMTIVKNVSTSEVVLIMRKCHIPQRIIIPLSVTLRYFPAIKEDLRHIQDAMKLRKISGFKKFECTIVPLMISAINTGEELSAAAVTRGIENPIRKTSIITLNFGLTDIICIVIGVVFVIITVTLS